jgi:hypothetical protein
MLSSIRRHKWSPQQRAVLISVVSVVMASLFVTTYSLALGDPTCGPPELRSGAASLLLQRGRAIARELQYAAAADRER